TAPQLVLDTRTFDETFSSRLIESSDNIGNKIDSLLVQGDNFQSMSLLQKGLSSRVRLTYIDPPYNTGQDEFIYKDNYQSSSWLTMLSNRFEVARRMLTDDGVVVTQISDQEHH